MPDIREIMIEEGCSLAEAEAIYIDKTSATFDAWKDRAKEEGTYHNPLIRRDQHD